MREIIQATRKGAFWRLFLHWKWITRTKMRQMNYNMSKISPSTQKTLLQIFAKNIFQQKKAKTMMFVFSLLLWPEYFRHTAFVLFF